MEMVLTEELQNLVEQVHRFTQAKLTGKAQARLEGRMELFFKSQHRLFLKGFARFENYFEESVTPKDLGSLFMQIEDKTFDKGASAVQKGASSALLKGGQSSLAQMGFKMDFDLKSPYATGYLSDVGGKQITKINETTRKRINGILTQSIDEGWSYNKTAKAIGEKYSEMWIGKPQAHIASRAHFIAVTETGNAYLEGRVASMQHVQDTGLPMEKFWSTMNDANVSDGCAENQQAGWIPLKKAFPSTHDRPLRFPGCRCDVLFQVAEKAKIDAKLEGYKSKYGIDPKWTDLQRNQFIDEHMEFALRSGSGRRGTKDLEALARARINALENLARQPDEVVASFLKRGQIVYTDTDEAFEFLYTLGGTTPTHAQMDQVVAFYDSYKNRVVFRLQNVDRAYHIEAFSHEMGHYVQDWSLKWGQEWNKIYKADKTFDRFTKYAKLDGGEGFAESYTALISQLSDYSLGRKFAAFDKIPDWKIQEVYKLLEKAIKTVRK